MKSELFFLVCNEVQLCVFHSKLLQRLCAQVELVCGFVRFDFFLKGAFIVYVAISLIKENMKTNGK